MAISAGMVWEVQNGGDDTNNGGGFRGGSPQSAPSAPSLANAGAGGTIAAGTYYFVITYTDGNGETSKSAEANTTTSGATSTITVTHPTDPGVRGTSYKIYAGTTTGGPYWAQTNPTDINTNKTYTSALANSGTQAPGTDYSQSTTAQVNVDNATITATTAGAASNVITFTGYVPTAADIGNIFHATAGTNITAGAYEITAFTATTWTVSGAGNLTTGGGAGAAIVGKMGGCFASPGQAANFHTGNNTIFVKYNATAYTMSASNNVAGGNLNISNIGSRVSIIGYNTTRSIDNTDVNRPTFKVGANSMTLVVLGGSDNLLHNVILDNSGANTSALGATATTRNAISRCKANAMTGNSFVLTGQGATVTDCETTGQSTGNGGFYINGANGGMVMRCVAHANATVPGFYLNTSSTNAAAIVDCLSYGNTGATNGFSANGPSALVNCTAYGNNGTGFIISSTNIQLVNCLSVNNTSGTTAYGFDLTNGVEARMVNCAAGGNKTGDIINAYAMQISGFVSLSADPFTNAAGGDFSLNSTAGGGAACKGTGAPSLYVGTSSTSYPDIGGVQGLAATAGALLRNAPLSGGTAQ